MERINRRRGGSFHLELVQEDDFVDSNEPYVQFATPYYSGREEPEPLDLSKLCLDDDLFSKEQDFNLDFNQEDEEGYYRGRSRSRSVHENDANIAHLVINSDSPSTSESDSSSSSSSSDEDLELKDKEILKFVGKRSQPTLRQTAEPAAPASSERTGPLQQREVMALKKGLEEATYSLNPQTRREEEEERMVADAEKRKRIVALSGSVSVLSSTDAARRVKILILGDGGVGKSSLITRWTQDTFSPSLTATVGVNFKSKKLQVGEESVQVQVWDTAGQEQFHKITTSYYKGAQGIMLVYDLSSQKSFDNTEYWIKKIKENATANVQVALIGNKSDLRSSGKGNCVDMEQGKELALRFGVPFCETSAKDSSNVNYSFEKLVENIISSTMPAKSILPGGGGQTPHYHPPEGTPAKMSLGVEKKKDKEKHKLFNPLGKIMSIMRDKK